MPVMSIAERWFCQSPPWRWVAGRLVLGWALQGVLLRGAVLELGGGSGAMAEETIRRHPDCELTVTDLDPVMVAAAERRFANEPRVTARHHRGGKLRPPPSRRCRTLSRMRFTSEEFEGAAGFVADGERYVL